MTDIEQAIENIESRNLANIVREYEGFIIMAQSEEDYKAKVSKINRGDCFGFYTVARALRLQ